MSEPGKERQRSKMNQAAMRELQQRHIDEYRSIRAEMSVPKRRRKKRNG